MHKEVSTAQTSSTAETFSFWQTMKQNRRVHYLHKQSCPTDDGDPLPRRKTARIWSKSRRSYNAEIQNLFSFFLYQTRKVRGDQGGAAWWVVSIFSAPGVQRAVCSLGLSFSNSTPRVGRRDLRRPVSSWRCCTVAWLITAVTMASRGVKSTWMIPWMCQENVAIKLKTDEKMSRNQVQSSHLLFECTVLDEGICELLCHSRRQQNNVTIDKGIREPTKAVPTLRNSQYFL